jgi:hypothetical protein
MLANTPIHPWLKQLHVSFVPGITSPALEEAVARLLETFRHLNHTVQPQPDEHTDLILTTAPFAQPLSWREAVLFTARPRFRLKHTPTIVTLLYARPAEFQHWLDHFDAALRKNPLDPADFTFPGLAPTAYRTLIEQSQRGGAILALERMLQAQSKSIRIVLFVGEDKPDCAYLFDLVGAHPRIPNANANAFYTNIVLRLVTALSTTEVTQHEVVDAPIPYATWRALTTPAAMLTAARELDRRDFFTPTVQIAELVSVPAVHDSVARQYSEGCFATWEPQLDALIATVTGSARPVNKGHINEDDLAVIVGVRPDGQGARVRHVEGKRNDPPSSESVEMIWLDEPLPRVTIEWQGKRWQVPVARSKLHGHRGVAAFHPDFVEYVAMDAPYHYFPVSCATDAQARGIRDTFARARALNDPADARQVVFTLLPGHGVVIVEKWQTDKQPFQTIWEYIDAGYLHIDSHVPQGPITFVPQSDGKMHLQEI